MWLTKDVNYGDPTPISPGAERGSYIFFDPYTWQRTRVSPFFAFYPTGTDGLIAGIYTTL